MQLRRLSVFLLFFLMVAILTLPFSCFNQPGKTHYHDFLRTEDFKKMSRADMVSRCSSCHKGEYENEKAGPHANAYQFLSAHKTFVNSKRYDCPFYTKRVNKEFESCAGCHAPQNLLQTMLFDSLGKFDNVLQGLMNNPGPLPPVRRDETSRLTSIDCYSCHYDGHDIVSLKHVATAADSNPVMQTPVVIATNNLNCYPCHFDVVRSVNPAIAVKRTGRVMCVNCHQEYDATGKGTHYYYWKHDAPGKSSPWLVSLMDDFHFHLLDDHKTGEISWRNTTVPHIISSAPEAILTCEVFNKDSDLLGTKTIRINDKNKSDKLFYKALDNNYLYGEAGDQIPLNDTTLNYTFPLKRAKQANYLRITLKLKPQYWFPDSLGVVTNIKTYAIK